MVNWQFIGGRDQKCIVFTAIQVIEADVPGTLEQAQQCSFCFTCASIVGVDDERLCCIICSPLVIEGKLTQLRLEGSGRGILARPPMFILRFKCQSDRNHILSSLFIYPM